MSVVSELSVRYQVIGGKHKGRYCNPRMKKNGDEESVRVVFVDKREAEFATIKYGDLVSLEKPGWKSEVCDSNYGLQEYLEKHQGGGSNKLRTELFSQPRVIRAGDQLASGQIVLEESRQGYNSTILLLLDGSGWVEIGARYSLALIGNQNFKFPIELLKDDVLVTSCVVGKESISVRTDWTRIFLDHHKDGMEVPSCLPLAME